jgi:hypothetical protein
MSPGKRPSPMRDNSGQAIPGEHQRKPNSNQQTLHGVLIPVWQVGRSAAAIKRKSWRSMDIGQR